MKKSRMILVTLPPTTEEMQAVEGTWIQPCFNAIFYRSGKLYRPARLGTRRLVEKIRINTATLNWECGYTDLIHGRRFMWWTQSWVRVVA